MRRGFTLIETIIYLALFSILMAGILSSVYILFESSDRNQSKATLQEEKEYLLGKINWALNGAQTISTPAANASGSFLSAIKYDTTATQVGISGTNMTFNGVTLNNSNVKVTNLTFIHTYAGGANPESLEAGFTLSIGTPNGMTISQIASTTRYIRK